jgi:choline monooxygenase
MDDITTHLTALLEREQGLPGRFFTDEDIFSLERREVFESGWMCIGLAADAPAKGTLLPLTVLGYPLLIVNDGGPLRVFHNVCRHRGAVLVEAPARGAARIVCPYHSWTYKLQGELVATPHLAGPGKHGCEGFEVGGLGLQSVRSAEWAGHLFVNLSGTAPLFKDWIRPIAKRFENVSWAELRHDAMLARNLEVAANWKIICENFVESYHLPWVHRALNAVNPMDLHYQILGGHSYLGQGGTGYQRERVAGTSLPRMTGLQDASRYESLIALPNLILGPLPDMTFSIILLPQSACRTRERLEFFFVGDQALAGTLEPARRAAAEFIASVNSEDVQIVESVQRGRSSPAFTGGRFAPAQEATSLQFQKIIAARLLARGQRSPEDIASLTFADITNPTQE